MEKTVGQKQSQDINQAIGQYAWAVTTVGEDYKKERLLIKRYIGLAGTGLTQ